MNKIDLYSWLYKLPSGKSPSNPLISSDVNIEPKNSGGKQPGVPPAIKTFAHQVNSPGGTLNQGTGFNLDLVPRRYSCSLLPQDGLNAEYLFHHCVICHQIEELPAITTTMTAFDTTSIKTTSTTCLPLLLLLLLLLPIL